MDAGFYFGADVFGEEFAVFCAVDVGDCVVDFFFFGLDGLAVGPCGFSAFEKYFQYFVQGFGGVYPALKIFTFADGILAICIMDLFAATLGASRTDA